MAGTSAGGSAAGAAGDTGGGGTSSTAGTGGGGDGGGGSSGGTAGASAGMGGMSGTGGRGGIGGGIAGSAGGAGTTGRGGGAGRGGAIGSGGSGGTGARGGSVGAGGTGTGGTGGAGGTCATCPQNPPLRVARSTARTARAPYGGSYTYELWSDGTGSGCMTVFGTDATFSATWTNVGDFLARVGLSFDQTKTPAQIGTISADFAETKTGGTEAGLRRHLRLDAQSAARVLHPRRLGSTMPAGIASDGTPRDHVGNDHRRRRHLRSLEEDARRQARDHGRPDLRSVLQHPAERSPVRAHLRLRSFLEVDRPRPPAREARTRPRCSSRRRTARGRSTSRTRQSPSSERPARESRGAHRRR